MRKIREYTHKNRVAKVYRDHEWGEYRVKFYAGGVHMDASDYHTSELDDALDMALYTIEDECQWTT